VDVQRLTSLVPSRSSYTDSAQAHPHRQRSPPDAHARPLFLPADTHDDGGFYGGGWMQQDFDIDMTSLPPPASLAPDVADAPPVREYRSGEWVAKASEPPARLAEAGSSSRPGPPPPHPLTQPQPQRAQLFDALRRGEMRLSSSGSLLQSEDAGRAGVTERGAPRTDTAHADAAARLYVLTHRRSAANTASASAGSLVAVPPSQADASRNPGTFDLALHLLQAMRDRRPAQDEMRALVDTVHAALASQAAERALAAAGNTTQARVQPPASYMRDFVGFRRQSCTLFPNPKEAAHVVLAL
jgi:hypothetical protein